MRRAEPAEARSRVHAPAGTSMPPGSRAVLGCAAVTTESAARAFGLRFHPLEEHVVQVWLAERWRDHPGVGALGDLLTSAAFTERVEQFGGYDLAGCGARL